MSTLHPEFPYGVGFLLPALCFLSLPVPAQQTDGEGRQIVLNPDKTVTITWTGGPLQSATDVRGPYTTVNNASPLTITPKGPDSIELHRSTSAGRTRRACTGRSSNAP